MFKNPPIGGNIIQYIIDMTPQDFKDKIDMAYFEEFGMRDWDKEKFFKIIRAEGVIKLEKGKDVQEENKQTMTEFEHNMKNSGASGKDDIFINLADYIGREEDLERDLQNL